MVRNIITKLAIAIIALTISACDPPFSESNTWNIYNNTEQILIYQINDFKFNYIYPGEYSKVYVYNDIDVANGEKRDVNRFFIDKPDYESLSIYLRNQLEAPVKVWKRSDKDTKGKQFFNPKSWYLRDNISNDRSEYGDWIFEITSEDLK